VYWTGNVRAAGSSLSQMGDRSLADVFQGVSLAELDV